MGPEDTPTAACRGCLASGVKLYSIIDSRLVENYAQLVGISLQDHYTQYLCVICATLLQKFSTFRERCKKAYQLLMDAEFHGKDITTYIRDIDIHRYSNQFILPYVQTETQTRDYGVKTEEDIGDYEYEIEVDSHQPIQAEDYNSGADNKESFLYIVNDEENEDKTVTIKEEYDNFDFVSKDNVITVNRRPNRRPNKRDNRGGKIENVRIRHVQFKTLSEEEIAEYANSFDFTVKFLTIEEQCAEIEKRKAMNNEGCIQCELCGKKCSTQRILDKHYEFNHNKNLKYNCSICQQRFGENNKMLDHLDLHKCVFECKSCPLKTKYRRKMQDHYLSHNGKKYECEYCHSLFDKQTTCLSHVRLKHAALLPWCDICGESFMNDKGVKSHQLKEHRGITAEFSCTSCGAKFYSKSALDKHEELKRCDLDSCGQCGEAFLTEQLLRYHLVHHQRDTLIACKECDTNFYNKPALTKHMALCGTGVPCALCGGHFDDETAMLNHANMEHSSGTDFKCAECDKQFQNAYNYKIHVATHRNRELRVQKGIKKKPSKLKSMASRRWRPAGDADVVELRQRVPVTPASVPRATVCEVCGWVCYSKSRLQMHLLTHTDQKPYPCQECSKSFRTKMNLKTHMRVHSGDKPYECELCPKAFKSSNSLARHFLVHTGERLHVCHICEKTFQTSTSVKTHIKSVHMKIRGPPRIRRRAKTAVEN